MISLMEKYKIDEAFAEKLVRLRLALPLRNLKPVKIKDVAEGVGVNVNSYSTAENGVIPGEKVLTRIARYYNVTEAYLLGKENKGNNQATPTVEGAVVPIAQAQPGPGPEPPNIGGQFMEDINHLKVIYDYSDLEIINAIHSNLRIFNRTVQREIEVKSLKQKVSHLEGENAELHTRMDSLEQAMEQLLAKQLATQENRKTGTNA